MLTLTLQYGQIKPKTGAELFKKKAYFCSESYDIYFFLSFNYYKIPSGTTLAGNKTLKNSVSISNTNLLSCALNPRS